jgi:uncharacterized DUF497 family protein
MYIADFIWQPDVIEKVAVKHQLTQEEIEEVFFNQPKFRFLEPGRHTPGENVYSAEGQTDAGRYISVFFILKSTGDALILSARDMTRRERRRYQRK